MTSDPRLDLVERFFRGTGSTYDVMVHAATFGVDRFWKRRIARTVRDLVGEPAAILDLACGTGLSTFSLARVFPRAHIVGVELREEYLQYARAKLASGRFPRVTFTLSRAETFATDQTFDVVTSSYLAKYADLPLLVDRSIQWLRPGGIFLAHDFTLPPHRTAVRAWRAYFWVLQTVGSRVIPSWKAIYDGLPVVIERTRWTSELLGLLTARGFRDVTFTWLTLWGSAIVTARAPEPVA